MYTMWDAPSDRDYYDQFNPEPPEDEEPEPEPESSKPYEIAPACDYAEQDDMVDPFAPPPEHPSPDGLPEVA